MSATKEWDEVRQAWVPLGEAMVSSPTPTVNVVETIQTLRQERHEARAEVRRLLDALTLYGEHGLDCMWGLGPSKACTCGLNALLRGRTP